MTKSNDEAGYDLKVIPGGTVNCNGIMLTAGESYILLDPDGKELCQYTDAAKATAALRRRNRNYFRRGGEFDKRGGFAKVG